MLSLFLETPSVFTDDFIIDELMDFFEDYRARQEEIVNEAVVLQESRVDDVCGELDEYMSKLEGDGQSIGSIEHHDDQVLVFMNGIIDEL